MAAPANPFIPSPPAVNRSAPTGANIPSISLPQNHTLASDPMNQLAQTLSMGMNVPAYDPYGNNGYYSRQMAQQSPLMQRYLMPQANSQNPWLTTAMQRGMPGWTSNGDGSFKPAQYNPFQGLNTPPTQGGLPAQGAPSFTQGQNAQQGSFTPEFISNATSVGLSPESAYAYQTDPKVKAYFDALNAQKAGQNAQQGSFTPEFIANAQSVGLSPESAYAYQTDPKVKAYFDALNAQKAGASPASDGAQSTAPNVGTMTANENRTMTFEGAAPTQLMTPGEVAQAVFRQRYMAGGSGAVRVRNPETGQLEYSPEEMARQAATPTLAQVYANAKSVLDAGGSIYDNALSSVGYVPQGGESVAGGVFGGYTKASSGYDANGKFTEINPARKVAESPASTAQLALLSGDNPYGTVPVNSQLDQATYNAYMSNPAVKAYLDAMAAQRATQSSPKP